MPLKNKNRAAGGVITIHTPTPLNLKPRVTAVAWADVPASVAESRRSPYCRSVMTRNASPGRGRGGGGGREGGRKNQTWVPRSPRGPCVDWLSHSSFRRLQAKLESENQETGKIIQPLLDTEKGFIKDLERFLSHQDVLALRKKELLHRHWTERVWTPIQRNVEDRATNCWSEEADRIRSMFMHYINYCNNKGFVSLEDYDPLEYNPLLQNINKPQFFKVTTRALKDPLFFQSRERVEEKRAVLRCQTGHLYTRREVEKLLKQSLPHQTVPSGWTSEMCSRSADLPLLASPTHQGSTSRAPLVEMDPELWKLSRTSVTPYQLTDTATPDRRCLQAGCWSSRG
ncbi:protein FAM228A isoform X2 [Osmerus mordax]